MSLNINSTVVQPMDFFREISAQDGWVFNNYDKHVEVSNSNKWFRGQTGFEVREREKLSWFNPLRFHLVPISPEGKLANIDNLASMTEAFAKDIVNDEKCDLKQISIVFERLAHKLSRNITEKQAQEIYDRLEKAVICLQETSSNEAIAFYENGQPGRFHALDGVAKKEFYNQLSHSLWPVRFNQRFHINPKKSGGYDIHLTSNRWFFEKVFRWPAKAEHWSDYLATPQSPGIEKAVNAKHLAKMIADDHEFIRSHGMDVSGMVANLERLKGRMTKNTYPHEARQITEALDKACTELRKIGMLIAKDSRRTWPEFFWEKKMTILTVSSLALLYAFGDETIHEAMYWTAASATSLTEKTLYGMAQITPPIVGLGLSATKTAAFGAISAAPTVLSTAASGISMAASGTWWTVSNVASLSFMTLSAMYRSVDARTLWTITKAGSLITAGVYLSGARFTIERNPLKTAVSVVTSAVTTTANFVWRSGKYTLSYIQWPNSKAE